MRFHFTCISTWIGLVWFSAFAPEMHLNMWNFYFSHPAAHNNLQHPDSLTLWHKFLGITESLLLPILLQSPHILQPEGRKVRKMVESGEGWIIRRAVDLEGCIKNISTGNNGQQRQEWQTLTSPALPKASAKFSKVSAIVSPPSPGSHHHPLLMIMINMVSIVMIIMIMIKPSCCSC